MASSSSSSVKVVVELAEGSVVTTKLWRFNSSERESYTLKQIRDDVQSLFLHLVKKELTVELSHIDDFVGKV